MCSYFQVHVGLKADTERISSIYEDVVLEEVLEVVDERNNLNEGLNIPVKEEDVHYHEGILNSDSEDVSNPSEDIHYRIGVLNTMLLKPHQTAEIDGSDTDPFSSDAENPNGVTGLKLDNLFTADSKMMNEDSECNGSPNMIGDFVHFNTENSSEMSKLASLDSHIVAKIITAEGIYENIFENTGSPNTVDDLICSDNENPSELLELESPDNHTVAKVMTAEGVEDNISKSTADMVLVSPNGLESGMDYSAPGEAQESLMNETDIELNPEQVNQEAEQIISDGDKAYPELNREQAIEEAEQIISAGDKVVPELNPEQVNQVAERIISDGDKAGPELNREQAIEEAEQIVSAGDKVDPELNCEQVNQEAGQIISDGEKVTHESVVVSDFTGNRFSTNANDDINNPTYLTSLKKQALSDTPASKTALTQVSENNENNGRKLQAFIGEEDKSINENAVDEKPMRPEISIRQLKKQLKKLSIKNHSNTNKDDKVAEARPALKAVCDNQLATTETDN